MATYKKGVLGTFSGKVGTVIGSSWKGIDYMRSLPRASSKAATSKQLKQRVRFALVRAFLKPLNGLLNKGFQSVVGNLTPVNAAVSYHIREAVLGTYPDFLINYQKVLISRGELVGPKDPEAVANSVTEIGFNWLDNSGTSNAKPDDKVTVLVYNPTANEYIVAENAADRIQLSFELAVPANFTGNEVHCWITCSDADGSVVATSVYLGALTLP